MWRSGPGYACAIYLSPLRGPYVPDLWNITYVAYGFFSDYIIIRSDTSHVEVLVLFSLSVLGFGVASVVGMFFLLWMVEMLVVFIG